MQFTSEMAALEYTVDTMMDDINYKWDLLMMEHAENLNAIEYKVLCENGTDEDLNALYLAEAEATTQKSKGLLGGIISIIRNIIKKIKELLFGTDDNEGLNDSLKNVDPSMKFELPADPDKLDNEAKGILGKIRSWLSSKKIGERFVDANLDAILAAPTIIAGGAIYNKVKSLGQTSDDLDKAVSDCEKVVNSGNLSQEELSYGKKLLSGAAKCGKGITNIFSNIKDKIKSTYHTSKEHGKGVKIKSNAKIAELEAQIKEKNKIIKEVDAEIARNDNESARYFIRNFNKIKKIHLDSQTIEWDIPADKKDAEKEAIARGRELRAKLVQERNALQKELDAAKASNKSYNDLSADAKLRKLNDEISDLKSRKISKEEKAKLDELMTQKAELEAYMKKHHDAAKDARRNIYDRNGDK